MSGQSVASDPAPARNAAAPVSAEQPEASAPQPAAAAFKRSLDRYAAGDLHGALEAMRESHRLSNRTELLYNIARIEEEIGDCEASLADYNRYLELVPNGRYRQPATEASQKLGERCPPTASTVPTATVAPQAVAPPAPPAEPKPKADDEANPQKLAAKPRSPPSVVGWAAIALGAAAGAGAVYFTVAAADAHDRFQRRVDAYKPGSGPLDFSAQDEQHRNQRWATVLAVTGGALVTGGVVVVLLAPRAATQPASTAALHLTPGQLGASFSHSF
jgi:tetratricopeptide (TPR) repeat protein